MRHHRTIAHRYLSEHVETRKIKSSIIKLWPQEELNGIKEIGVGLRVRRIAMRTGFLTIINVAWLLEILRCGIVVE